MIKSEIENKTSKFYYKNLYKRFTEKDTTLTKEDFKYLYYGYVFQPKYTAYWHSPVEDKLKPYYDKQKLETKDYDEIIKLCNASIADFPFCLREINFATFAYHQKGDFANEKKLAFISQNIIYHYCNCILTAFYLCF